MKSINKFALVIFIVSIIVLAWSFFTPQAQLYEALSPIAESGLATSDSLLLAMRAITGAIAGVALLVMLGQYRESKIYKSPESDHNIPAIHYLQFRQTMSEILELPLEEIDMQKDQLVDRDGKVPIERVIWFRDKYSSRYEDMATPAEPPTEDKVAQ